MKYVVCVFCMAIAVCSLNAGEPEFPRQSPPFSIDDFSILSYDRSDEDSIVIRYIRKQYFSGTITYLKVDDAVPRIDVTPLDSNEANPTRRRVGETTAKINLNSAKGVVVWTRDGQEVPTDKLVSELTKPKLAIMLRTKPKDWEHVRDYAQFLHPTVVFIYPGDLFVALERAER